MGLALAALSICLVGCQNMNKQDVGVLTGAALGGLVGSRFGGGNGKVLATFGGAIAGGAIGGLVGNNMDKTDSLQMQQTLNNNKINQVTKWRNPKNGGTYTMKPVKTYYPANYYPKDHDTKYYPREKYDRDHDRRYDRRDERRYRERERDRGTGPCREYYMTADIGGKKKQIYGKACRQADGSWKVVK